MTSTAVEQSLDEETSAQPLAPSTRPDLQKVVYLRTRTHSCLVAGEDLCGSIVVFLRRVLAFHVARLRIICNRKNAVPSTLAPDCNRSGSDKLHWHDIQLLRCDPQVIVGPAARLVPQFLPEMKEAVQQETLSRNAQTHKNHSDHDALHLPPYRLRLIDHGSHRI